MWGHRRLAPVYHFGTKPPSRLACQAAIAAPPKSISCSLPGLLLSGVHLARRADIPVRSNVFRGNGQQIRNVSAFGRGCGQECQSLSILPELERGMVGAGVI